jgi:hypothetical protein
MSEDERLRDLHDTYVWEVNAAVGEGRLDLVWQFADDYLDRALELITDGEPVACGRVGCAVCERPRRARAGPSRRRGWMRRRGTRGGEPSAR